MAINNEEQQHKPFRASAGGFLFSLFVIFEKADQLWHGSHITVVMENSTQR